MLGVFISASISLVSCILLLFCFWKFPKWRNRPAGTKHVLLVLTIYDLIAASLYFIDIGSSEILCRVQGSGMQFFEVGGWIWSGVLSVELSRHLYVVTRSVSLKATISRGSIYQCTGNIVAYHILVEGYGLATVLAMNSLDLIAPAGDWCWTGSETWKVQTYVTLWCVFIIVLGCSVFILQTLKIAREQLSQRISIGSVRPDDARSRRRYWATKTRLLGLPFIYALLHVPGTLRRTGRAVTCQFCASELMATLQGIFDPAQGTVNLLFFGFLDVQLRNEIFQEYPSLAATFMASEEKDTLKDGMDIEKDAEDRDL